MQILSKAIQIKKEKRVRIRPKWVFPKPTLGRKREKEGERETRPRLGQRST